MSDKFIKYFMGHALRRCIYEPASFWQVFTEEKREKKNLSILYDVYVIAVDTDSPKCNREVYF